MQRFNTVDIALLRVLEKNTIRKMMIKMVRGEIASLRICITTEGQSELDNLKELMSMGVWRAHLVISTDKSKAPFMSASQLGDHMRLINVLICLKDCNEEGHQYTIECGGFMFYHRNGKTYGAGEGWERIGDYPVTNVAQPLSSISSILDILY